MGREASGGVRASARLRAFLAPGSCELGACCVVCDCARAAHAMGTKSTGLGGRRSSFFFRPLTMSPTLAPLVPSSMSLFLAIVRYLPHGSAIGDGRAPRRGHQVLPGQPQQSGRHHGSVSPGPSRCYLRGPAQARRGSSCALVSGQGMPKRSAGPGMASTKHRSRGAQAGFGVSGPGWWARDATGRAGLVGVWRAAHSSAPVMSSPSLRLTPSQMTRAPMPPTCEALSFKMHVVILVRN